MLSAALQEAIVVCGDCYRWAYRFQKEHPGAVLVHGTAQHREGSPVAGRRYDHAWVEYRGKILDWQIMAPEADVEGVGIPKHRGKGYPPDVFKKEFKPREERRYETSDDALEGVETGARASGGRLHFGPWHKLR